MGCSKILIRVKLSDKEEHKGWRLEDVWIDKKGRYKKWEPHVQAMKNESGDLALRFCSYKRKDDGSRGRFINSASYFYDWTMKDLREEAKKHDARVILMLFKMLGE